LPYVVGSGRRLVAGFVPQASVHARKVAVIPRILSQVAGLDFEAASIFERIDV
jgi:hypothetical protein